MKHLKIKMECVTKTITQNAVPKQKSEKYGESIRPSSIDLIFFFRKENNMKAFSEKQNHKIYQQRPILRCN